MIKVPALYMVLLTAGCWMSPALAELPRKHAGVQWLSLAETEQRMQRETRPIIVDVYTDWCHYCKVMDATTWKHDSVAAYVQQYFHPLKLNAEDKATLSWQGKQYEYLSRYKVNRLAVELLRGNMVYPSTVIIPENGEWEVIPGALKPAEMEMLLKYYGSRAHRTMDFAAWQKQFSGKWR